MGTGDEHPKDTDAEGSQGEVAVSPHRDPFPASVHTLPSFLPPPELHWEAAASWRGGEAPGACVLSLDTAGRPLTGVRARRRLHWFSPTSVPVFTCSSWRAAPSSGLDLSPWTLRILFCVPCIPGLTQGCHFLLRRDLTLGLSLRAAPSLLSVSIIDLHQLFWQRLASGRLINAHSNFAENLSKTQSSGSLFILCLLSDNYILHCSQCPVCSRRGITGKRRFSTGFRAGNGSLQLEP